MSATTKTKAVLKGGEWLVKESSPFETFIPEDFVEEQRMIRDMCNQFLDVEVYPILDRIDNLETGLMKSLVTKAGEQGLLSVSFPEEYGGLGKDFVTSTIVNEYLGAGHSFSCRYCGTYRYWHTSYFIFWNSRTENKNIYPS
jgi:alkylation response protein AidB-like acyl-CoA dehydrogenase